MMHVGEGEGIYSLAFCSVLSLQVYDACGGRGRGYTAWLSTVSYHHCKCMMQEGEGIYSLAFCSVISSLQVYDACGGDGGDIQPGLVTIASV